MRLFLRRTKRKNGTGTEDEWKELDKHVAQFDAPDHTDVNDADGEGEEGGEGEGEDGEGDDGLEELEEGAPRNEDEDVPIASVIPDIEEERRIADSELIDRVERECEDADNDEDEEEDEASTKLAPLSMAERKEACIMVNKVSIIFPLNYI